VLRPGLLEGVSLLVAGAPAPAAGASAAGAPNAVGALTTGGPGADMVAVCAELGANVLECRLACDADSGLARETLEETLGEVLAGASADDERIGLLAVDAASVFAQGVGARALRACLDASWAVTRALAEAVFLKDGRGGRVVYVAPAPGAGEHADAARAGLENLARTLSIEWARHAITTVAIAPGGGAGAAGEVAALTAYMASPAGAYFSGCLLDLRGPSAR
jgi:NAD(P)-dependent dehydrogenase (short-subunit alcohol dehydrogenase family)